MTDLTESDAALLERWPHLARLSPQAVAMHQAELAVRGLIGPERAAAARLALLLHARASRPVAGYPSDTEARLAATVQRDGALRRAVAEIATAAALAAVKTAGGNERLKLYAET